MLENAFIKCQKLPCIGYSTTHRVSPAKSFHTYRGSRITATNDANETRRAMAGREGLSGFPSFQYLNGVCDWTSLENREVDPNEGSIYFAHV